MWRLHIRVFHLCGNFNFGCSNLKVCLVLRGYREGTGMGGVRKFWRIFRKGKGLGGGRELGTENPIHNTNLTICPISFLTSFSHEISLKLESSTFSLPPFTTCDVIFCCCIGWKWNLLFLFPPFDTCDVTFWLNQYLSLIKFASIPYPWTNEERMNHRVNIKNEVKPGAK